MESHMNKGENTYRTRIIAVDFDGTLCIDDYPNIGEPIYKNINYIKRLKNQGWSVILWTCRVGKKLQEAINWCRCHNLEFDSVNDNLQWVIDMFDGDTRKIYADVYLDDKMGLSIDIPDNLELLRDWGQGENIMDIKYNCKCDINSNGMRTFETGFTRDISIGKGRMDLLPWNAILELSKHSEKGAIKYGERNIDKGAPQHCLLDSGLRHLAKYMMGHDDEDHLLSALWNIAWAVEQDLVRNELNNIPSRRLNNERK